MDADQIERIAKDANDTSNKAYNLLLKTLSGEGKTSEEIEELNRKYVPPPDETSHFNSFFFLWSWLQVVFVFLFFICDFFVALCEKYRVDIKKSSAVEVF